MRRVLGRLWQTARQAVVWVNAHAVVLILFVLVIVSVELGILVWNTTETTKRIVRMEKFINDLPVVEMEKLKGLTKDEQLEYLKSVRRKRVFVWVVGGQIDAEVSGTVDVQDVQNTVSVQIER